MKLMYKHVPTEKAERLSLPYVGEFYHHAMTFLNFSENSAEAYTSAIKMFMNFCNSTQRDWKTAAYVDIFDFVVHCNEVGYARTSICLFISGIVCFYKYLEDWHHFPHSTVTSMSRPRLPEHLPDVLYTEEVDAIIAQVPTHTFEGIRDRAIFDFLFATGVRVSELCNLRMMDVHLDDHYATVLGKGRKVRDVIFSDSTADMLRKWLQVRPEAGVSAEDDDLFFISKTRKHAIGRNLVYKKVKWYAEAAGIKKNVHPHTFRHSFATALLDGGANIFMIKRLMGHASIDSTSIYLHLSVKHLRNQIENCHPRNILWKQRHAI